MDEQARTDVIVQTIRRIVDDPHQVNVDLPLMKFPKKHFSKKHHQFLEKTFQAVVSAYQDREVGIIRHLTLVWILSDALAIQAGVTVDRFHLCLASFMHDIGKAAVVEPVFMLPRKLTEEEDRAKKRHTVLGGEICQRLGEPFTDVAPFVRSHHENWNGTGYPDGLVESKIPTQARLLRVADVISALRTKRHYRDAFSKEETLEIISTIQRNGPVFDPSLMRFVDDLLVLTK